MPLGDMDLLSLDLSAPQANQAVQSPTKKQSKAGKSMKGDEAGAKTWYDLFADLDPIGNPDAIHKKSEDKEDNRYC